MDCYRSSSPETLGDDCFDDASDTVGHFFSSYLFRRKEEICAIHVGMFPIQIYIYYNIPTMPFIAITIIVLG